MLRTVIPLFLLAGCASRERLDFLDYRLDGVEVKVIPSDAGLEKGADLDRIVAIALARYPSLRESLERARAMSAMAGAAGRLEDPTLRFRIDDQPLRRSASLEKAVLSLEQMIPWPGKLDLQREDAVGRAEAMLEERRARERDVVLAVKRAYFDYFRWTREREVRLEHVKLLDDIERLSQARYEAGKVSQQDILKPQVERGIVRNELFEIEQMIATAQIRLNLLMDRAPDAPLGPPAAVRTRFQPDPAALVAQALETRPEILAANARIRASLAARDLAEKNRLYPDFSIGVEYMQRPDVADEGALMAGINLPWITGRRSAEAAAARRTLSAEEASLELARNTITMEVREAVLRLQALDREADLIEKELLVRSRQSTEAATSGYESALAGVVDVLDAERSERDIKLAHYRVLAGRETALAELERAVGADLGRKP